MLTVREAVGLAQYHGLSTEKARLAALCTTAQSLGVKRPFDMPKKWVMR